ncbi:hypothetical protein [Bacteroides ndongoniae]|uniref:hypothetical protein n=1 Tax=Bacteroides ndongoniae TaxID=1903262 RepID=UPI0023F871C2|nr:hypothetical protein [Bacteroides ndongoniae]
MEKIIMKPHAVIDYNPLVGELYGILRFNTNEEDWEFLPDIYTNRADAQSKVDELNQEVGNVTITFP